MRPATPRAAAAVRQRVSGSPSRDGGHPSRPASVRRPMQRGPRGLRDGSEEVPKLPAWGACADRARCARRFASASALSPAPHARATPPPIAPRQRRAPSNGSPRFAEFAEVRRGSKPKMRVHLPEHRGAGKRPRGDAELVCGQSGRLKEKERGVKKKERGAELVCGQSGAPRRPQRRTASPRAQALRFHLRRRRPRAPPRCRPASSREPRGRTAAAAPVQSRGCSLNERSIHVVAVPHQWPASPRLQPRAAAPPSPAPPAARRRRAAARGPIGSRAEDQLIRTSSGRPTPARGPRAAARRRRRRSRRAARPPRHRRRAAVARAW